MSLGDTVVHCNHSFLAVVGVSVLSGSLFSDHISGSGIQQRPTSTQLVSQLETVADCRRLNSHRPPDETRPFCRVGVRCVNINSYNMYNI